MSGGENNVGLDLPKLQPTISDYNKAYREYETTKRDYENAQHKFNKANLEYNKTQSKYIKLIAHPNISKARRNYAKFYDKPVETVNVMHLEASSAGVIGWLEAFTDD